MLNWLPGSTDTLNGDVSAPQTLRRALRDFAMNSHVILGTETGATLCGLVAAICGGGLWTDVLARAVGPLLTANGIQSFFANWKDLKPDQQASKLGAVAGGFTAFAGLAATSTAYRSDQAANYLNRWGGAFSLVPELADLREAWINRTRNPWRARLLVARAVAVAVAFVFTLLATAEPDETSDESTQRLTAVLASVFPFIATLFGIGAEALRPGPQSMLRQ